MHVSYNPSSPILNAGPPPTKARKVPFVIKLSLLSLVRDLALDLALAPALALAFGLLLWLLLLLFLLLLHLPSLPEPPQCRLGCNGQG